MAPPVRPPYFSVNVISQIHKYRKIYSKCDKKVTFYIVLVRHFYSCVDLHQVSFTKIPDMANLHLEHCLESLEALPGELRRNFTLMHDLDHKNKTLLQDIDAASDDYLRKARDLSESQKSSEMGKIQKLFKKAKEHGDEKVNIAIQTYEMVDKHIRRLDSDLAKFEAEMKEQGGRLSQTETEDESTLTGSEKKKKVGRKAGKEDTKSGKKRKGNKEDEDTDKGRKKKGKATSSKDKEVSSSVPSTIAQLAPGIPQEIIEMPIDPNEPTYCICQDVSWGEMIGCDNNDCPIEWFHFGCMGLTTKPKGKWYCPKCIHLFKKKK